MTTLQDLETQKATLDKSLADATEQSEKDEITKEIRALRRQIRVCQLVDELLDVQDKIRAARKGTSVSLDGHSLSRQSLDVLRNEEIRISDDIEELLRGHPFGSTKMIGRYDHTIWTRSDNL